MKTHPSSPVADAYLSQKKFEFAEKLAAIATDLDESKDRFPECYVALGHCVETMHETAEILAGERVGEIYDQTDEVSA